jgi:hypothetical protein
MRWSPRTDAILRVDEEDIFGSDFESTDEETAQADVDTGEKTVDDEEKRARKVRIFSLLDVNLIIRRKQAARSRLEKTTAAAHARNKVTFNPQASTSTFLKPKSKKIGRRVSFADAGQILDNDEAEPEPEAHETEAGAGGGGGTPRGKGKAKGKAKGKRQSRRSHTVLNTSATVSRMKSAEKRRVRIRPPFNSHKILNSSPFYGAQATNPKKQPTLQKSYTQAQLLSRALDTEEGNIIEHRDYLQMEEEKRRRARVVRKVVEGPKIKWVSRGEEVKVPIPVQVVAGYGYTQGYGSGYYPYTPSGSQHYPNVVPNGSGSSNSHFPNVPPNQAASSLSVSSSTTMLTPTPIYYSNQTQSQGQLPTSYYYAPQQPPPPLPTQLEKVCKNYVVHEISQPTQVQGQTAHLPPKPLWEETMAALFGGDVKWEDIKVWSGKGRPLCTFSSIFSLLICKPNNPQPVQNTPVPLQVSPRSTLIHAQMSPSQMCERIRL